MKERERKGRKRRNFVRERGKVGEKDGGREQRERDKDRERERKRERGTSSERSGRCL